MPEITLRQVAPEDLTLFFEHQQDAAAAAMAAMPSRARDQFMAHWSKILADSAVAMRTIEADGRVAGNVGTFVRLGKREVCYWLGRDFWGKGVASEAVSRFVAEIPERPLYARVAKRNSASLRVLEKAGFRLCGEDSYKSPSGEAVDEFVLTLV